MITIEPREITNRGSLDEVDLEPLIREVLTLVKISCPNLDSLTGDRLFTARRLLIRLVEEHPLVNPAAYVDEKIAEFSITGELQEGSNLLSQLKKVCGRPSGAFGVLKLERGRRRFNDEIWLVEED